MFGPVSDKPGCVAISFSFDVASLSGELSLRGCAAQGAGEGCAPHSSPPPAPLLVEMPVLVGFHLGQTQHCILTLPGGGRRMKRSGR